MTRQPRSRGKAPLAAALPLLLLLLAFFGLTQYYIDNPPEITVADPSVCTADLGDVWNLANVVGLKLGKTTLTEKKDLGVAVIGVSVVSTAPGTAGRSSSTSPDRETSHDTPFGPQITGNRGESGLYEDNERNAPSS